MKTGEDGYLPFSYQSVEDENRLKCISCATLTDVLLSFHFTSFELLSCWCKTHTLLHHHTCSVYSIQFQFSQLLYTSLDYFMGLYTASLLQFGASGHYSHHLFLLYGKEQNYIVYILLLLIIWHDIKVTA